MSDTSTLTTTSSSTSLVSGYDMLSEYEAISAQYFQNLDPTKLRTGMFGYLTESMARGMDDIILDSMFRAKEYNVSTAERMDTLLLNAASIGITVGNAVPATIDSFIGIPTSVIFSKGTKVDQNYTFIIDKDSVMSILGYPFMLDYDIQILAKSINGLYNYSSQYVVTQDNQISTINNPYLITTVRNNNGADYVFIRVLLRQISKSYSYHTVIENDDINLIGIEFDYSDQLAYFNAWYMPQNQQSYTKLELSNILTKTTPNGNYLTYDTTNNGCIEISTGQTFKPEFNSEIRIDIFTTKGSSGVFSYKTGTVSANLISYENSRDYAGIDMICIPISDSIGGTDQQQMEDLRTNIINERATLGGLSTDNDLNIYFSKLDNINDMLFIKKRSDIIERRFTAYMIPRDSNGFIIPTSTVSLDYVVSDFDAYYEQTNRRIIAANTKFSLAPNTDKYTLAKNVTTISATDIATTEEDQTKLLFGTPYLIVVNENPESVSYYLNSIDKQCNMKPEFINTSTTNQFVVNFLGIQRNAVLGDTGYTLSVNIIPNGDVSSFVNTSTGAILDNTILQIYGTIYDINSQMISYIPFTLQSYNKDSNYFTFTAVMSTNDYLSLDNQLAIQNSLYLPLGTSTTEVLISGVNVKFGICVYFKEPVTNGRYIMDQVIPNMTNYTLTNIYTNDEDLANLYVDMTNIIRSTVTLTSTGYNISEVPLVRYSYLNTNASLLSNLLLNTKFRLDEMNQLITENFSIDFKFYRTYGASTYFKVGDNSDQLDRLDISLTFNIYPKTSVSQSVSNTVMDDIKNFIKTYLEQVNISSGTGEASIYFSNITTAVETNYSSYIQSIALKSLDMFSYTPRTITYDRPDFNNMTSDQLRSYVPEYINVPISKISLNTTTIN